MVRAGETNTNLVGPGVHLYGDLREALPSCKGLNGAAEREVLLVLAAEEGDDLIDLLGRKATHERHPTLASHEDVAAIEARSRSTPRTPHRRSPSARAPRGRGRRG